VMTFGQRRTLLPRKMQGLNKLPRQKSRNSAKQVPHFSQVGRAFSGQMCGTHVPPLPPQDLPLAL